MKLRQIRLLALGMALGVGILSWFPSQALGQTGTANVTGTVRDAGRAVVPGAAVTATNSETNVSTKTKTNQVGIYYLGALPRGPYTLVIEKEGFRGWEVKLELQVGQNAVIDSVLVVGNVKEVVEVKDTAPVVTTQSSEIANVKDFERIRQLPLNGREVGSLFSLTPGVEGGADGARVNGMKVGSLGITVDGISVVDRFGGGIARVQPGLDTVQEFRIETAGSDARYSRPSNVTISTRSGTNQIHGSIFETHRNNSGGLLSRRREDQRDPATGQFIPRKLIRNEYGVSAGGPVYLPHLYDGRNKSFWFAAFEGLRNVQQTLNVNDENGQAAPTEAMWNGNLSNAVNGSSGSLNPVIIYDPLTTDANGVRQPFPGNIIPADRISPLAHVLSALSARPNTGGNPYTDHNLIKFYPDTSKSAKLTLKGDQHFTENDYLAVRYSRGTQNHITAGGVFGNPATPSSGVGTSRSDTKITDVSVNYNRLISNSILNEVLVGVHRSFHDQGTTADFTDWANRLTLPNPFSAKGWPTFCAYNLGFYYGFCWDADNHNNQALTSEVLEDNVTWNRGKHTLKFGGSIHLEQNNVRELQQAQGSHTFDQGWTGQVDPSNPSSLLPDTGDGFASMLLGLPVTLRNQYNRGYFYFRQKEMGLYFTDTWKVSPRLTLNLGLRWDKWTPYQEKENRLVTADTNSIFNKFEVITPGNHDIHTLRGIPPSVLSSWEGRGLTFNTADAIGYPSSLFAADNNNFGPRLGVAFKINDKTVLRGSYGEYFWTMPLSQILQASRTNPPLNLRYRNGLNERTCPSPLCTGFNYTLLNAPAAGDFLPAATVDISAGAVLSPGAQQVSLWDGRNWKEAHSREWHVTLEREVLPQTALRVSYIGNHGSDLEQHLALNSRESVFNYVTRTGLAPPGNLDQLRLNKDWNPSSVLNRTGFSNTNSGQVELEHRFAKGVAFQWFYTYTRSLNTTDSPGFSSGGAGINDTSQGGAVPENIQLRGEPNLTFDQRLRLVYYNSTEIPPHRVRFNGVVDLPFGRGKKFGNGASGVLNQVIGGWQVTTIGEWRSGFWRSVSASRFQAGDPRLNAGQRLELDIFGAHQRLWFKGDFDPTQATNVTGGNLTALVPVDRSQRTVRPFGPDCSGSFNTNRLAVTLADLSCFNAGTSDFFNNGPRARFLGPGAWNTDISIIKNFKMREQRNIRFSADFFNALNHPNDIDPDPKTGLQNLNFQGNEPRTIQLSLRIDW